jgi:gliding motility-associated-like protein
MFHLVNGQQTLKPQFIRNSNDLFGGDLIKENNLNVHYQSQKHNALFLVNKGKDFVFFDSFGFTILSTKKKDSCFVRYDFINANHDFAIVKQGKSQHYYTSQQSNEKSFGYKQVVYRNLYNQVDFVVEGNPTGLLKYSFVLRDNASLKNFGFKLSGSFDSLAISTKRFDVIGANYRVIDTGLVATNELGKKVECWYQKAGKNEIRYAIDLKAKFKQLVIDPFVIKLDTLEDLNLLKKWSYVYGRNTGIEVDFDHHGNVYVYGGEHNGFFADEVYAKLAKYNNQGELQWVFQGYDSLLDWNVKKWYGKSVLKTAGDDHYSDVVVNKTTAEIYVGQGYAYYPTRIIRLKPDGQHGNFISDTLKEGARIVSLQLNQTDSSVWAFGKGFTSYWPKKFIPKEMAVVKPNGQTQGYYFSPNPSNFDDYQYIVCGAQDFSGHKYAIFSNVYAPLVHKHVCKLSKNPGGNMWMQVAPINNLYYLNLIYDSSRFRNDKYASVFHDYRANVFSVNQSYVFSYDGRYFGAMSVKDGSQIGATDSVSTQTILYQTGIAADACNHVFLAGDKGQIRCYSFDGSKFTFDTTLQLGSGVVQFIRDVKYDFSTHTILVTGDSILAAVPSPYKDDCDDEILKVNLNKPTACNSSVDVRILNADTNSVYSFEWFLADTNVLLQERSSKTRTADTLNGLKVGTKYRLRIYRNKIVGHFYRDYIFTAGLPSDTFLQFSRCMGDSFVHSNRAYFTDTLLKDTLLNSQGCDSVVSTQLIFLKNSKSQIYKEICLNDTLVFGGKKIATAGLYRDTITNHLGCDSVIELTVKVNYPKQRFDTVYYCNQPQVNYKGKIRTLPALLKDTFLTFEGCDSVVNTALFTDTVKAQFAIDSALKPNIGFVNLSLNAINYLWDFGDGATDTSKNPLHTYSDLNMWSSYQPCLIAINAKNCSDTFCENFKFYLFKDVKIVEGFSPNADGVNDTFYIENSRFYPNSELYIMNRYGQIILHKTQTQNQNLYWDGNYYKPKELLFSAESSEGLYYYFYKYNNASNSVKQGNLYLKR